MPDHLSEVHHALDSFLARRLDLGGILDANVVFDEFLEQQLHQFDLVLRENKRNFLDDIYLRVHGELVPLAPVSDTLRQRRTAALWAGLRRVYFHVPETDDEEITDGDNALPNAKPGSRRRTVRVSSGLNAPTPILPPPDDSDDDPSCLIVPVCIPDQGDNEAIEGPFYHGFSQGGDADMDSPCETNLPDPGEPGLGEQFSGNNFLGTTLEDLLAETYTCCYRMERASTVLTWQRDSWRRERELEM